MSVEIFCALVPVQPGHEHALEAAIEALDRRHPFADVPGTHIARLVVLRSFGARSHRDRRLHPALLSFSVMVDRPVDTWLRSMFTILGAAGEAVWRHCAELPDDRQPTAYTEWLGRFRLKMHLSVIGNPDASVDQVLAALDKRERLRELALSRAAFVNPKQLRYAYDEAFGLSPGEPA